MGTEGVQFGEGCSGDLIALPKGDCSEVGISLFCQVSGLEEMASNCTNGGSD